VGREALPGGPPESLFRQRSDVVVFACGDPAHAEHSSVAIAACTGLPAELLQRVDLKITGPMRPEYLRDLAAGSFVIIADTVPAADGEIVDVPFSELVGREVPLLAHSTPDQPLDEVVAMAELLRDEPLHGRFLGLGTRSPDLTAPPDEVEVAVLRAAVREVIEALRQP
jgi:hypothetical protein